MIMAMPREVARVGGDVKKWVKDEQVTTDQDKRSHRQQTLGPVVPTVHAGQWHASAEPLRPRPRDRDHFHPAHVSFIRAATHANVECFPSY